MSIKDLTDYIGHTNIAEDLDEHMLNSIGARVKRQFQEDHESMSDWIDNVERGIELMRQEWAPKSTPWEGASNYKDPIMTEASVKFGDKASLELLRSKDLVTADVVGRDPQGEKEAMAERVKEYMNYQINHEMEDWRDDQERVFYSLPNYGTIFKKVVHDEADQTTESIPITFPNFAVNQATKSMEQCRSFTHILDMSRNDVEERVQSGAWLDLEIFDREQNENRDDKRGDKGSNEDNQVIHAAENEESFLEQHCFFDIDGDGYEEPYIVTIHSKTNKVVRIIARYDEQSIIVKYQNKTMPLSEAKERYRQQAMQDFGGQEVMTLAGLTEELLEPDMSEFKLRKIQPFCNITKYGFIPAPDGTFLDFGYAHLLAAMTQAINTTTNQLTDAAKLSNVGGGLLSREHRKTPGLTRLKPGQYNKTDVPADKLKNSIVPNPAPEPSETLYRLNADMLERAQGFLALVDVSGKIQSNTAPTTALAMIEEAVIPTTALFRRILKSESSEFKILFRINQRTLDADDYREVIEEDASPQQDFASRKMDIFPSANAEMSSKMQRIQTAQIELEQFDRVTQAGGNPLPILRNFFDAIGSDITEQVFPEEGAMSPQEKEQVERLRRAQELENELQEKRLAILSREQDRLDRETEADIRKINNEIKEIQAGIIETITQAQFNAERAETEHVENEINRYTGRLERLTEIITKLGGEDARPNSVQSLVQQGTNQPGAVQPMASGPGNQAANGGSGAGVSGNA